VNGENESIEEVDMGGSESDQELTGNETDESQHIHSPTTNSNSHMKQS
jgi:hypothetical protein